MTFAPWFKKLSQKLAFNVQKQFIHRIWPYTMDECGNKYDFKPARMWSLTWFESIEIIDSRNHFQELILDGMKKFFNVHHRNRWIHIMIIHYQPQRIQFIIRDVLWGNYYLGSLGTTCASNSEVITNQNECAMALQE